MSAAPFEIIPAWRIARLRAALRDAEQRGANPDDEGHDLSHRALQRRFALARGRATECAEIRPPGQRPHEKAAALPHLKLVIIWRAILSCRSCGLEAGRHGAFWQHPQGA